MVDIVNVGLKVDSRDVKNGTKELDRFGDQAKKTGRETKKLETATGKLSSSFKRLGGIMAAAFTGVLIKKIIDNTIAQEQAIAQLDAALVSTKGAVGLTSKELQKMAREMQAVSTYGDEVVMGMQSILLTFTKVGKETFPRASQAIVDLSARMGMDLKSAALQVGKALNDPATGLSMLTRAGIQFTDAQKEVIKGLADTGHMAEAQALILEELETQFGGSALAARNTMGGALTALKNAFGDLLEADSGVPGATNAINDLTKLLGSEDVKKAFAALTGGIIKAVEWSVKATKAFVDFGEAIGVFFAKLSTGTLYKTEKEVKSLTQQISEQEYAVRREADALAISMKQYEEITKHIEAMEKISGVLPSTLEILRQKQAEAAADAKRHADALAEEKARLDELTESQEVAKEIQEEEEIKMPATGFTEEQLEAAAESRQRAFEEEQAWLEELDNLEKEYADEQARAQKERDDRAKAAKETFWSDLLSLAQSKSKTMFEIGKKAAIAAAIIDGYKSAISAWRSGMETPGPWAPLVAAAYTAASLAKTATLIGSIRSSSFSGGGGSISSGGVASVSSAPAQSTTVETTQPNEPIKHDVSIVVSGGLHSDEDVRNLVSRMEEIREDMGANVSFVTS